MHQRENMYLIQITEIQLINWSINVQDSWINSFIFYSIDEIIWGTFELLIEHLWPFTQIFSCKKWGLNDKMSRNKNFIFVWKLKNKIPPFKRKINILVENLFHYLQGEKIKVFFLLNFFASESCFKHILFFSLKISTYSS